MESLPPKERPDAALSERDASEEPDPIDAGGDDAQVEDAAERDASEEPDPIDAGGDDAQIEDAGEALDAATPDAATPDCVLAGEGGASVSYRTGELGALVGSHVLTLVETGLCATPAGCGLDLGSDVVQASCGASLCQRWESADAGAGWFRLRNARSGACLYMTDSNDATHAITWECIDSDRVRWQAACAGDGSWHLISKLSSKLLAGDGRSAPDAGVVQSAMDGPRSRWQIASNPSAQDVVIASAETDPSPVWRYTTANPGASWAQPSFDDNAWSSGPGAFGSMSRSDTPVRTPWTSGDIWLRRAFTLASVPGSLTVKIFHDEDAEIFINGALVGTLASWSHGYQSLDVPASVRSSLVVGSNTIAVHCRNASAPQIIDVGLVSYP